MLDKVYFGHPSEETMAKLLYTAKAYDTPLAKEEALVCEALVREIGRAQRRSAVLDAFNALLHTRNMAGSMSKEANRDADLGDASQPHD